VTDRELAGGRAIEDIINAAVKGGVTAVQLREKECTTLEYIELAKRIKRLLLHTTVPLIINDRIDVALASAADGVHVGQNDMPYADARRLMGKDALVGLTVETMEQAREAEKTDADYLGVSTIYATPTKTDAIHEWGLEGLKKLRHQSNKPLVAIGGINLNNSADVIRAGANGIAVVSAICAASDPELASRELKSRITHTG
jgi:thiamine-phosphate pyrophosphorylase